MGCSARIQAFDSFGGIVCIDASNLGTARSSMPHAAQHLKHLNPCSFVHHTTWPNLTWLFRTPDHGHASILRNPHHGRTSQGVSMTIPHSFLALGSAAEHRVHNKHGACRVGSPARKAYSTYAWGVPCWRHCRPQPAKGPEPAPGARVRSAQSSRQTSTCTFPCSEENEAAVVGMRPLPQRMHAYKAFNGPIPLTQKPDPGILPNFKP